MGAYTAPAWASGASSVSAATAAMSAASTKASVPLPAGTVIAPPMRGRWLSVTFCITQAGRTTQWVMPVRAARSASTALMSIPGGAVSAP